MMLTIESMRIIIEIRDHLRINDWLAILVWRLRRLQRIDVIV